MIKKTIHHLFFIGMIALSLFICAPLFADDPHAFPVPFAPGKDPTQTKITFTDLPGHGSIKIYTIDGELVVELPIAPGQSILDWPVTNKSGEKVATGIYLYDINGVTGKLVVIR